MTPFIELQHSSALEAKTMARWMASGSIEQGVRTDSGEGSVEETAYFVVANPQDYSRGAYVLPLSNPSDIAHARAVIADPANTDGHIVTARIDHGGSAEGYTNCDPLVPGKIWSWRVTEFLGFADYTIEIYDGWAQFVEDDVQGWIDNTGGIIGFWSSRVVSEFDGVCPAITRAV